MRVIPKVPSQTQKEQPWLNIFCCDNTLPLLIELEKLIQISVHVSPIICRISSASSVLSFGGVRPFSFTTLIDVLSS